jgi:hypothetical protein
MGVDELSWDDLLTRFEVRECKVCMALIANDGRYGRKANKVDKNVCECCEVRS